MGFLRKGPGYRRIAGHVSLVIALREENASRTCFGFYGCWGWGPAKGWDNLGRAGRSI